MSTSTLPGPRMGIGRIIINQLRPNAPRFESISFYRGMGALGDMSFAQFGPMRIFFINSPELAHDVLVERADEFHKSDLLKKIAKGLGNGLLLSEGDFWRRQRKLIQPAFHARRIEAYADTMVRQK